MREHEPRVGRHEIAPSSIGKRSTVDQNAHLRGDPGGHGHTRHVKRDPPQG